MPDVFVEAKAESQFRQKDSPEKKELSSSGTWDVQTLSDFSPALFTEVDVTVLITLCFFETGFPTEPAVAD